MFSRASFGTTTATSPPTSAFRNDFFAANTSAMNGMSHTFSTSPKTTRHPSDNASMMPPLSASLSDPSAFGLESRPAPAIVIRRLPRTIGVDALRSMLIFAGDLIDTELIQSPYPEDQGFATAVARFQSSASALEAQQKLHGKPNTTKEANMIVEAHSGSPMGGFERRNTIDGPSSRAQSSSASSGASGIAPPPRSRFGSTYQSAEAISPPLPTSSSSATGEFPIPESSAHFQNLFSPQSPLANGIDGHHRVSGKSMINDDSADDETGDILKDPLAYAKSGQHPNPRRQTNPQLPIARFGSLSLSTANDNAINGLGSPPPNGMTSPRAISSAHSSLSPMSPGAMVNTGYMPGFTRPQYPPVNPADQNPPCNTLYVGNLPIDTSEDELKHLFSKQRGYKRLCFRTKQNGPMCFVEFEDISFATKALHELYGHLLRNSVKGGIRLSFSKNPLGVRSGQTSGLVSPSHMSPQQVMAPGYGSVGVGAGGVGPGGVGGPGVNFSSITGPPPGLGTPPGLVNAAAAYRSPPQQLAGMDGMFAAPFGLPTHDFAAQLNPRAFPGAAAMLPPMDPVTYGREAAGYADYSSGR